MAKTMMMFDVWYAQIDSCDVWLGQYMAFDEDDARKIGWHYHLNEEAFDPSIDFRYVPHCVYAKQSSTPCHCGDGSCILCDDNGMVPS